MGLSSVFIYIYYLRTSTPHGAHINPSQKHSASIAAHRRVTHQFQIPITVQTQCAYNSNGVRNLPLCRQSSAEPAVLYIIAIAAVYEVLRMSTRVNVTGEAGARGTAACGRFPVWQPLTSSRQQPDTDTTRSPTKNVIPRGGPLQRCERCITGPQNVSERSTKFHLAWHVRWRHFYIGVLS